LACSRSLTARPRIPASISAVSWSMVSGSYLSTAACSLSAAAGKLHELLLLGRRRFDY